MPMSPGLESEQPESQNLGSGGRQKKFQEKPSFFWLGNLERYPSRIERMGKILFIFLSLPCPKQTLGPMSILPVMVVAAAATQVPKIQKKSFFLSRGAGKRGPCGPKSERRIPVTFFLFFFSSLFPKGRPSCDKCKTEQRG